MGTYPGLTFSVPELEFSKNACCQVAMTGLLMWGHLHGQSLLKSGQGPGREEAAHYLVAW